MTIEIFILIAFLFCIGVYFFFRKENSSKSKANNQSPRPNNKENSKEKLPANSAANKTPAAKTENGFDSPIAKILAASYKDSDASEEDKNILKQMREAGSKIEKPHDLEFFFKMPSEQSAKQLADKIRSTGFQIDIKSPDNGNVWLCKIATKMVPNAGQISALGNHFSGIARDFKGEYNGWETSLVK